MKLTTASPASGLGTRLCQALTTTKLESALFAAEASLSFAYGCGVDAGLCCKLADAISRKSGHIVQRSIIFRRSTSSHSKYIGDRLDDALFQAFQQLRFFRYS